MKPYSTQSAVMETNTELEADLAKLAELAEETDAAVTVPVAKIDALDAIVAAVRADAVDLAATDPDYVERALAAADNLEAAIDRARGRKAQPVVKPAEPGRNDPCPCASGRKFKACCQRR